MPEVRVRVRVRVRVLTLNPNPNPNPNPNRNRDPNPNPNPNQCTDTNDGATDVSNVGCTLTNGITPRPTANMGCHLFDDDDFTAKEMCCVCGGGFTPIPPNNASVYHVG